MKVGFEFLLVVYFWVYLVIKRMGELVDFPGDGGPIIEVGKISIRSGRGTWWRRRRLLLCRPNFLSCWKFRLVLPIGAIECYVLLSGGGGNVDMVMARILASLVDEVARAAYFQVWIWVVCVFKWELEPSFLISGWIGHVDGCEGVLG